MSDLPLFDPFQALEEVRRAQDKAPLELPQKLPQAPAGEKTITSHRLESTSAASATSAGVRSVHAVAPAREEEEEGKENLIKSYTYARNDLAQGYPGEHAYTGPAEVAEAAEETPSHCADCEKSKTASAEVLEASLRKWEAGLAALSPDRAPCPGYTSSGWAATYTNAVAFLDAFGRQAEAMGWSTPDLFAVHPKAGAIRVDYCGALMLGNGGPVRLVTATEIRFEKMTYRRSAGQAAGIPVWEFGR